MVLADRSRSHDAVAETDVADGGEFFDQVADPRVLAEKHELVRARSIEVCMRGAVNRVAMSMKDVQDSMLRAIRVHK